MTGRRYRLCAAIAATSVMLCLAAASGAAPTARASPVTQLLSNESTFTRWAYVNEIAAIHRQPDASSAALTHLHWNTEDGYPEVYLLLRAVWDAQGQEWIDLRIPGRPNGRTGWVPRGSLGAFHLTHQLIVVNREKLQMYFYLDGRLRWSAPVGVGAPSTPTPAGRFWIRERFKIDDPSSGYWPYAFGTSDYSTLTDWPGGGVVGIHGPYYAPQLIPGRISHGCIRLGVADDEWLAEHLDVGTPLHVI
ncbi:MAG TPA: L,D-transpeptidase [Solirubrobacteraceae bacterium]